MSGTFVFQFPIMTLTGMRSVGGATQGFWYPNASGGVSPGFSDDAHLLLGNFSWLQQRNNGGSIANITYGVTQNNPSIALDGAGAFISLNETPAGFVFTGFNMNTALLQTHDASAPHNSRLRVRGGTLYDSGSVVSIATPAVVPILNVTSPVTPIGISLLSVIFDLTLDDSGGFAPGPVYNVADYLLSAFSPFSGTYDIKSFTFTTSESPVKNGTVITIKSSTLDLSKITAMQVAYGITTIPMTITFQDSGTLIFTLSGLDVDQPVTIRINGSSTEFSGFMFFGKLMTIYFTNAKGIYQITPDKAFDTLYDPGGGTVDVKIPNPTWKTGFIGG